MTDIIIETIPDMRYIFLPIYDGLLSFVGMNQNGYNKPELKHQYLAGLVEATELLEELPWKWWKRYDDYKFNLHVFEEEVADIILFLTSGIMIANVGDPKAFIKLYDVFIDIDKNNTEVQKINKFIFEKIQNGGHNLSTDDRLYIYSIFTEYIQSIIDIRDNPDKYIDVCAYTMSAFFKDEYKLWRIISCVVYKNTKNIFRIVEGRNKSGINDINKVLMDFITHATKQYENLVLIKRGYFNDNVDNYYLRQIANMITIAGKMLDVNNTNKHTKQNK